MAIINQCDLCEEFIDSDYMYYIGDVWICMYCNNVINDIGGRRNE